MGFYIFEKKDNWICIYKDTNPSNGSKTCNELSEYLMQNYTMQDNLGNFYISKTHDQTTDIMTTQILIREYLLNDIIDRFPFIIDFIVETYL